MAMACEICTWTYNSEFFDSIDADSSDVEFQQIITFGCLLSLLTWAKNKQQLLKSSRSSESSDVGIPSWSSSYSCATDEKIINDVEGSIVWSLCDSRASCTRCHTHTPHPLRPAFLYTLQHKVLRCCRPAGRGGFLVLAETVRWRWRMSTNGPEECSIWPMQQHWNLLAKFRCCSWHG